MDNCFPRKTPNKITKTLAKIVPITTMTMFLLDACRAAVLIRHGNSAIRTIINTVQNSFINVIYMRGERTKHILYLISMNNDLLKRLDAAGNVGADLSPGDSLASEAAAEIRKGMKLFVWEGCFCDYTCGLGVVLAHDVGEARKILKVKADCDFEDIDKVEPTVYELSSPVAFFVFGGG